MNAIRYCLVMIMVVAFGACASLAVAAEDDMGWPPLPDLANTNTLSVDGRTIERFIHRNRDSWGYKDSVEHCFYLVHPKTKANGKAPLLVVLHSGNRSALAYLGYNFLNRPVDAGEIPSDIGEKGRDDFFVLYLNSNNGEFWGGSGDRSPTPYPLGPSSAERRVVDTIKWATAKYGLDENRVYATGTSMGGCGGMGIALMNGGVFAAVSFWVPAGMGYAVGRMGFEQPPPADASQARKDAWLRQISAVDRADPPVVIDLSSQTDGWSVDQAVILNAAQDGRLPLIVGWGPFAHTWYRSWIAKYSHSAAVLAYPWLEIRRDEAYPVFTHASSDQRAPWLHKPGEFDEVGQINGYFRWKSVTDTPTAFAMRLWLESSATNAVAPREATADVTFRRLQQFKVAPAARYAWRVVRNGAEVAAGSAAPDAAGLLTIPRVLVATEPCQLGLKISL
ncbi:MAG: hypothetical protein PHR35_03615 [Kiritimatiellae bacterium]|nr:hypothetical protein [Kiritimatiellia bacterium]